MGDAFIQIARIIVGVHRQQAGSYRGMRTINETGRLASRLALALALALAFDLVVAH
ncbi:hypothetical protein J2Y74_002319 [Pseudomonas migulae]|uniref:hypothetical protein n=1 Tax=Pseudomonas migulae TaxID=78543 RepID=UPI00209FFFDB|nr:hypothetical protein [Pseudomonas migulae]MCP1518009.1 hypothetical protein [Pseudomonas migulae]